MDKSYLLHNLKVYDNAEEGANTLDLRFENIHYDDNWNIISDVYEINHFSGNENPGEFVTLHENVSLTGGVVPTLQDFKIVTITTTNNSGSSKTATCPKLILDPPRLSGGTVNIPTGTFTFYTVVPVNGFTNLTLSETPTAYSAGIEASGPGFHITPNATEETITWG